MNANTLNWTDNKVLGGASGMPARQNQSTQMQTQTQTQSASGAAPSTYQQPPAYLQSVQGTEGTSTRSDAYAPTPFYNVPGPPSVMDPGYIPGYLRSQIGKLVLAEFVLGSNFYTDKAGKLMDVGYNYFVLEDSITGAMVMCDLYSVKFVTSMN